VAFFRAAIIFPVVYAFAVHLVLHESQPAPFYSVMVSVRACAMVCLIYDVYFTAKSLPLAQTGEPKFVAS